ncbi:transferrin-binding protein-like solute binding protein [Aurantiacibacter odishensis]|uniref:transferrin-binding protein-like solute binding protein n=1 Tax=Aurantiacibacter odishensis TaxID=1155476 RepID=UPI000E76F6AA|nr:transferrin-binding protein-like solute binding protein [Aurantiacibacter odishensis]
MSGQIEAIAYGIVTPVGEVPTTGSADYEVRLYGTTAFSDTALPSRGDGLLTVNFASGAITGTGEVSTLNGGSVTQIDPWRVQASISAANKTFSGLFAVTSFTGGTGSIQGQFYGPGAAELGGAYSFNPGGGGPIYLGVMLGKETSLFPTNDSLRAMIVNEDLAEMGMQYRTQIDSTNGVNFNGGEPNPHTSDTSSVRYSEDTGSFVYDAGLGGADRALTSAPVASLSNLAFDGYTFQTTGPDGQTETHTVYKFRPADNNPELVLTYSSLLAYRYSKPDYATYFNVEQGYVAFGQLTPADAIPRTGQATYGALLYGQSDNTTMSNGQGGNYEVTGTGQFVVNFGAGTVGGSLSPWLYDPVVGTLTQLGDYTLETGQITYDNPSFFPDPAFFGGIAGPNTPSGSGGYYQGQFAGPNAEELIARWFAQTVDPVSGGQLDIFGAAVGKAGASVSLPDLLPGRAAPTLVTLPSLPPGTTSLIDPDGRYGFATRASLLSLDTNSTGGVTTQPEAGTSRLDIVYDSATGNYEVVVGADTVTFVPGSETGSFAAGNVNYSRFVNGTGNNQDVLVIADFPASPDKNLSYVTHGLFSSRNPAGVGSVFDAYGFYAGIPTAASEVPRTGSANYSVYLYALAGQNGAPTELVRSLVPGTMDVYFQGDSIYLTGDAERYNLATGASLGTVNYNASADISGFENDFGGVFRLNGVEGSWEGLFFGPAAQEVAATFQSLNGGYSYAGSLAGSRDPAFRGVATNFAELTEPTDFGAIQLRTQQSRYSFSTEVYQQFGQVGDFMEYTGVPPVRYDPATGEWTVVRGIEATFDTGDIDAAQSNDQFIAYGDTVLGETGVDPVNGMKLLNPAAGNSFVELTYTSFIDYQAGDGTVDRYLLVFGFETEDVDVPTTGSASYTTTVVGVGASTGFDGDEFYTVDGTNAITVNFGAGSWRAALDLNGTNQNTGATRDLGSYTTDLGSITGNKLNQTNLRDGADTDVGDMFAYFFGPQAAEIGGGFDIYTPDTIRGGDNQLDIDGVFFGKKD